MVRIYCLTSFSKVHEIHCIYLDLHIHKSICHLANNDILFIYLFIVDG